MEIKRDYYLNELIDRLDNGLIKIITGIRRCGKSYLLNTIFKNYLIEQGIDEEYFNITKKKIYGSYLSEYNYVGNIARMFLSDYFKGINSFDYLESYNTVQKKYVTQILEEVFLEEKMVLSIVYANK